MKEINKLIQQHLNKKCTVKDWRFSDFEKDIYLYLYFPVSDIFIIATIQEAGKEQEYLIDDSEILTFAKNLLS